ncbi:zinc finger protein 100-like [Anopheles bellator]|uniref:zinc finger protein 100-like n=1 Tax=Anopheles bellator TaxID=139047 RepID=UPI0026496C3F|nr:zinc finger protein 100-like [Anopheles bellator]
MMEEQVESGMCLLCLRCEESVIMKNIESELEKVDVLCQHFWFAPETVQNQMICIGCWDQVKGFHAFYTEVERVHSAGCIVIDSNDSNDEPAAQQISQIFLTDSKNLSDDESSSDVGRCLVSDLEIVLLTKDNDTDELLPTDSQSHDDCHESPDKLDECLYGDTLINIRTTAEQNVYNCDQSDHVFSQLYKLNAHKKRHSNVSSEKNNYECRECCKSFCSEKSLRQHYLGTHAPGDLIFGTYSQGQTRFGVHRKVHQGGAESQTRVECELCGKWLKNSGSLRKHTLRHKSSSEPQICDICGKRAPNSLALQSHKMFVHRKEKSFKCSICQKAFKRAFTLQEHMTIHTGDILYQCVYCPKSFNSSANMHAHRKGMHPVEWKKGRMQNNEDPSQAGC